MAEIIGPFKERKVVVNGWSVPFLTACEKDGGRIALTIDHRFGTEVDAGDFDDTAWFLAQAIAVALGYRCHPDEQMDESAFWTRFSHVHPTMAPKHMVEVGEFWRG